MHSEFQTKFLASVLLTFYVNLEAAYREKANAASNTGKGRAVIFSEACRDCDNEKKSLTKRIEVSMNVPLLSVIVTKEHIASLPITVLSPSESLSAHGEQKLSKQRCDLYEFVFHVPDRTARF